MLPGVTVDSGCGVLFVKEVKLARLFTLGLHPRHLIWMCTCACERDAYDCACHCASTASLHHRHTQINAHGQECEKMEKREGTGGGFGEVWREGEGGRETEHPRFAAAMYSRKGALDYFEIILVIVAFMRIGMV